MNAPRRKSNPIAVGTHPRSNLSALHPLALLLLVACTARTALRSPAGGFAEADDSADTGGQTGEVVAGTGAGGGSPTEAAGAGGAGGAGGIPVAVTSPGLGGAAGGAPAGTSNGAGGSGGVASPPGGSRAGAGTTAQGGATTNPPGGRAGGTTSTVGGATAIRGGASGGVVTATGNATAAGGSSRRDGGVAADGATAPGTPTITDSGYVTVSAGPYVLAGFVSSSTGGSGSSISLTYDSASFCASGTVGKNSTYNCWASTGFTVNQAPSGMSGSSSSLVFSGSTVTVSYVNSGGSILEFQLYDGSDYWCYRLPQSTGPTTKTIPFSSLNTKCWDNSGTAFTSGTPITAVDLVVPGSATTTTPFNYCFLGMTVQ